MYDFFISYTTRESEIADVLPLVERIVTYMEEQGLDPFPFFLDRAVIRQFQGPSEELWGALSVGILRSRSVVAIVSPRYFGSKWCRDEWTLAKASCPTLPLLWKAQRVAIHGFVSDIYAASDEFDWEEAADMGVPYVDSPYLRNNYPEWSPMVPRPIEMIGRRGGSFGPLLVEREPAELLFREIELFIRGAPMPSVEPSKDQLEMARRAIERVYGIDLPVGDGRHWADRLIGPYAASQLHGWRL